MGKIDDCFIVSHKGPVVVFAGGGKFAPRGHMEDHPLNTLVEAEYYRYHYLTGIVDHSYPIALAHHGPGEVVLIRPVVKTGVGPVASVS